MRFKYEKQPQTIDPHTSGGVPGKRSVGRRREVEKSWRNLDSRM
jgi:hypothetical protein